MTKHYGMKAKPIEIIQDASPAKAMARDVRRLLEWLRWQIARAIGARWR